MGDELVLDSVVEEPVETGAEETVDTTDAEPGSAATEPGAADTGEDAPVGAAWKEAKERLKDVPAVQRQVKAALHAYEKMKSGLPDGIEATIKRLEAVNQLDDDPEDPDYMPGSRTFEEVISNTIAERSFWRGFDTAFQAGDGRVVKQMIEANPTSFQKLIPEAMDHYQQLNPEAYSTYICKSVDSFFTQQRIPLHLDMLNMLLPESSTDPSTQRVIDAFQAIKKAFSTIQTSAQGKMDPKKVDGQTSGTTPAASGGDEQINLRHDAWLPDIRQRSEAFAVEETMKLAGKTKFTTAEIAKIRNFVRTEINVRTKADDVYQQRIKGLLKANNKAAFAMTVEAKHKKITSEAVKRIVPQVISERERAKPGPKPGQKPADGAKPATAMSGDEQFELIAGPPRTLGMNVDFTRTPHSMMAKDRAYVIGRSKGVRWRRK